MFFPAAKSIICGKRPGIDNRRHKENASFVQHFLVARRLLIDSLPGARHSSEVGQELIGRETEVDQLIPNPP